MYDTTLRDGAQMVGISLSCDDKIEIAKSICELGVAYLEGGWPGSNPKDREFFSRWSEVGPTTTKLCAFGSTRHKNKTAQEDAQVDALMQCGAPVVCVVAKAWNEQVEHVLEATLEQNLDMITETVEYLVANGREVMVDLEHFYDGCVASGYRGEQYALLCLRAAASAGASTVVLCDTNGGSMPWVVEEKTRRAAEAAAEWPSVRVGVHTHNDTGLAVANSLAAVRAGARLVQGCVNGYGERTGNADLLGVIGNLQVKMGYNAIHPEKLHLMTKVAKDVAVACGQPTPLGNPFVGSSAFAHKGGLHVAAVRKLPHSYNHMEPSLVGNRMRAVVSELSGKGNVLSHAEEHGFNLDAEAASSLLQRIKRLEQSGYSFEGAAASVDMMILRSKSDYVQPFQVVEYSVIAQNRERESGSADVLSSYDLDLTKKCTNQAMLKVYIKNDQDTLDMVMHAAEGNGPVDALSVALRSALEPYYPQLKDVYLLDYSVRLLDTAGSQSVTRVTVKFEDSRTKATWTCVGAHTSIIEASFRAVADGLEFGVVNHCENDDSAVNCVANWGEPVGELSNEQENNGSSEMSPESDLPMMH